VRTVDARRWPSRWTEISSGSLCIIGIALAAYLTYAHHAGSDVLACPDSATVNCAKVTSSSQSEILGFLPVADLGLAYFLAMLGLCLPVAWRARVPIVHRLRVAGVVAGVAMVVYLLYAELFEIDAICLYCTGVHVVTVLLFVVVLLAEPGRGSLGRLPPG
jgi:uncharacterized membrane protein